MKVAIMQPYFFPYLGYLSLIKHTDTFVLLDTVQFIRHGWIERNRILKPNEGWQYIGVPLKKHKRDTLIQDIVINNEIDWKNTIFRQLEHYKKRAPYYYETINVLNNVFAMETDNLTKLNLHGLKIICGYLGIETKMHIFSDMGLTIGEVNAPDEWALAICKAMGNVKEYWNPEGGLSFFNTQKYMQNNIDIKFVKINLKEYSQRRTDFETGLSIIDVMMFNSPSEINEMLDNFYFLPSM